LFVGHTLLGFSEKEVKHMTLGKLMNLYNHYQNHYDFTLSKMTYRELEEKIMQSEEWTPDD
jgi:hypothetical protein